MSTHHSTPYHATTFYAVYDAILENSDGTPYLRKFETLEEAHKYISDSHCPNQIMTITASFFKPIVKNTDDKREMRKAKMASKNK